MILRAHVEQEGGQKDADYRDNKGLIHSILLQIWKGTGSVSIMYYLIYYVKFAPRTSR